MFPALQPHACLLCRLSTLTTLRTQARTLRTLNRTKPPARLQLSPRVAQAPPRPGTAAKPKKKPNVDTTAWQLNRTVAPKRLQVEHGGLPERPPRIGRDGKPKTTEVAPTKKMQMRASLQDVPIHHRVEVKRRIEDLVEFESFGLLPVTVEAAKNEILKDYTDITPTPVQRVAIPAILGKESGKKATKQDAEGNGEMKQFLLAAETGSGKTLAYSLPILDIVKRQEIRDSHEAENRRQKMLLENDGLEIPEVETYDKNCKPKAVILLPTTELVVQVGTIIKKLAHVIKLRTTYITRDMTGKVIKNKLFSAPLDVLISTPSLLESVSRSDPNFFEKTTSIVVDEADSLFDKSFAPITGPIVEKSYNLQRLVLCSATIPKSLDTRLRDMYPSMRRLVTPNLHSIPRRVQLSIVDSSERIYAGNKMLALADTLSHLAKDNTDPGFLKLVIVFVNEREHAAPIADYLISKGVDAVPLDRDSLTRKDSGILELFSGPRVPVDPKARYPMKVLVTTDIASRGIDTRNVKTVVLYDDPHSTIDFIHRIGRTGRMGRRGRAIIIVDKDTDRQWVKEIKTNMYMGGALK